MRCCVQVLLLLEVYLLYTLLRKQSNVEQIEYVPLATPPCTGKFAAMSEPIEPMPKLHALVPLFPEASTGEPPRGAFC